MKMRVRNDKELFCHNCGRKYMFSKEMYEVEVFKKRHIVCSECCDEAFTKLLKASCLYNGRLKSQEDLDRKQNSERFNKRAKENV